MYMPVFNVQNVKLHTKVQKHDTTKQNSVLHYSYPRLHVKSPPPYICPTVTKILFYWQIFIKITNIKLHENTPCGSPAHTCWQTGEYCEAKQVFFFASIWTRLKIRSIPHKEQTPCHYEVQQLASAYGNNRRFRKSWDTHIFTVWQDGELLER
jgi:hypothetical protein